jgi:hypothetical protein
MSNPTPPSSYWERPEPNPEVVLEEAQLDADMLVSEWAAYAELELFITVSMNRAGEPFFELEAVQRDGILLEKPGLEVEDLAEIRRFLEQHYPIEAG